MTLIESLEKWGLSLNEIKVYLALLELGSAPVQEISRKTGVERTNTYAVLENLIAKGLVREEERRKGKKIFTAEPPEKLKVELKEKEHALDAIFPQLQSLYNKAPHKPKMFFFEGRDGMIAIANRSIEKAEGEILFASAIEKFHEITTEEYEDERYIPARIERGIHIRMIVTKDEWAVQKKKKDKAEMRETRFFPDGVSLAASVFIYGNEVSFITSRQELLGVVIESREVADLMKVFFEVMWKTAPKN